MENSETYVIEITRGYRKLFVHENLENMTWMKTSAAQFDSIESAKSAIKNNVHVDYLCFKYSYEIIKYSEAKNH